jgi:hypothetical protein
MLVPGRTGVIAVAVALGDSAVPVVNDQLGMLSAADLTSPVDGVLLIIEVARGATTAALPDIPPAATTGNDMM